MFASKFPSIKTNQTKTLLSSLPLSVLFSFALKCFFSMSSNPRLSSWDSRRGNMKACTSEKSPSPSYLGFIQLKEHVQKNSHYMNLGKVSPTLMTHDRSVQILTHYCETPTLPSWILSSSLRGTCNPHHLRAGQRSVSLWEPTWETRSRQMDSHWGPHGFQTWRFLACEPAADRNCVFLIRVFLQLQKKKMSPVD